MERSWIHEHPVAFWSGVASFFGSLLAIEVVDILNPSKWYGILAATIVALITGASVYAKQRLDEAKEEVKRKKEGSSD